MDIELTVTIGVFDGDDQEVVHLKDLSEHVPMGPHFYTSELDEAVRAMAERVALAYVASLGKLPDRQLFVSWDGKATMAIKREPVTPVIGLTCEIPLEDHE